MQFGIANAVNAGIDFLNLALCLRSIFVFNNGLNLAIVTYNTAVTGRIWQGQRHQTNTGSLTGLDQLL